jgi:hypothetical protein
MIVRVKWAAILWMVGAAVLTANADDLHVAFGRVYPNYTPESISKEGVVVRYGSGTFPNGGDARQSVKIPLSWLTQKQIKEIVAQLESRKKFEDEELKLDSSSGRFWIEIAFFRANGFYAYMSPIVMRYGEETKGRGSELIFIEGEASPDMEKGSNWTMRLYFLGVLKDSDRTKVFTRNRDRAREVLIDGKSFLTPEEL